MKKNIAKKFFLVFFIMFFLFCFVSAFKPNELLAIDTRLSGLWDGSDLDIDPQQEITYDSSYRYFSDIIDSPASIIENKIYIIESAYDVYKLSELSMGENRSSYLGLDYALGKDIDYYEIVQENINQRFNPIGYMEPFTGSFDGQGFEITNLYFDSIMSEEEYETIYPGLRFISMFSKTGEDAYIHDFGLINPIIIQPIEWGIMSYASAIVGENYGTIENVYLIDNRGDTAGFNAEGAFNISGLVSVNYGEFSNSYVSSKHIRSVSVNENESTSAVLFANYGTTSHLYYDQLLYADVNSLTVNSIGLDTTEFQNPTRFDDGWFYNDQYHGLATTESELAQLTLTNQYPILQGLELSNDSLEIDDATDFIYFNELLMISGAFRNADYVIVNDIDMNQISSDGYQAADIGFTGSLKSTISTSYTILYERQTIQGGDLNYHSIINLKINEPTFVGNYASYSLFSSLFGTIENLNIVNAIIAPNDLSDAVQRTEIFIGVIAGQMNHGLINNVHVFCDIDITDSIEIVSRLSIGGLIGEGSGEITNASTNGSINGGSHAYDTKSNDASVGGMIGISDDISISNSINAMDLVGISFIDSIDSTVYLGGIIGMGSIETMERVINTGDLLSNRENQIIDNLYLGGIIGMGSQVNDEISFTNNSGSLDVNIESNINLNIAGFGYLTNNDENVEIRSLTNTGTIHFLYPIGSDLTETELALMNVYVSGVLIADQISGEIEGLFNSSNLNLDLDIIDQVAGAIIVKNTSQLSLFQAYNTGNINLTSNYVLTQDELMVSGIAIGSNMTMEQLRNEGNISIEIDHPTSASVINGNLYVVGLFNEVSQGQTAKDGYNGGNITITKDLSVSVDYNVYASGIAYINSNNNLYSELDLETDSIDITYEEGSMDHFLNDGELSIHGNFNQSVRAAGILMMNSSLLTSAMNLGNIEIYNDCTNNSEAEAAGIVYLMDTSYAQLRDSANYGTVKVVSSSTVGYAHASGIVLRNDRLIDGSNIVPGTTNQLAKILFTVNYGDVYAWNGTDEATYTIINETRAKASGILTIGLLSIVNNVNYGNIYSKYLASGIIGFLYFNKFGTIDANQVYISNSINYGKIRQITAYDAETELFTINLTTVPISSTEDVFGAIVGKIHTGTSSWAFAGDVTYPIDRVYFGYLLNFDEKVNMFSLAPSLSTTWADGFGNLEAANDAILNMLQYMATTNPNDQSAEPFTYFYSGGWIGQYMGKVISYYDVSDTEDGMFYEGFAFRSFRPIYTGTDQYIRNFIEYIPLEKVNPVIISKIEADTNFTYPGIYALSSSMGIENGIFIPDNFDLSGLDPHTLDEIEVDTTWIGNDIDPTSIAYKLYVGMRQIQANFATSIYDMELKQTDEYGEYIDGGMILDAPIIDSARGLITYYLPSNAAVLSGNTSTLMDVYRFIEVSEGLGRMVPDIVVSGEQTYSWIGDYKKSGSDFVEIGPYNTSGIYNPTSSDIEPYLSTSRSVPVYEQTAMDVNSTIPYLYEHTPHTRFIIWWTASGYRLAPGTAQAPGFGAYETFTLANYPTLYRYVGPSQELVTYIRTDVINDITVYDPSTLQFKVNNAAGSYMLSENADILNEGLSQMTTASVPRGLGIYDSMYDEENTYIDGVEDHYGSVRIYSQSYNSNDPSTYKDYDIRIIRTADQNLIDIDSLYVNGIDSLPSYTDFRSIIANQDLNFELDGNQGVMEVTYQTNNIAGQTNVLPWISLYNDDTGDPIDPDLYVLSKGIVSNDNVLNNSTGSLGEGTVTLDLSVTDMLPSGSYRLELELITDELALVYVGKIQSSDANIDVFSYNEQDIALLGDTYTSEIPFGIYYNVEDITTDIVNFSNLGSLTNIYYSELEGSFIPSYLSDIEISPFSTLISVDIEFLMADSYRHLYRLTYTIEAEDGTTQIYYHDLYEAEISSAPSVIYKNGGEIDREISPIEIGYLESPTIRVEFDLTQTYGNHLSISSNFIPSVIGTTAIEDEDYYIISIPYVGYEVDLNQQIELGIYQFETTYDFSIDLWGESLVWSYEFDLIELSKIKNDDSSLVNIMFVSDTIYSGFNTIVDVNEITEVSYLDYLLYPENRIITVLPTSGIYYGDYESLDTYWIIGQVQKTNLSYYLPTFELPDGAQIKRVTDLINIGYEFQSDTLATDFSPFGDEFNFILYRVYAHDFDDDLTHYTDYYIAVQDMTNNIRFNLEVINESSLQIEEVYVQINVCQLGELYEGECSNEDSILSMTGLSIYDPYLDVFNNNKFQTTVYGTYQLIVDLPENVSYTLSLQSEAVFGLSFYLENSLLPRKYYVVVTIVDDVNVIPWGQREVLTNFNDDPINISRVYEAGEYFSYDEIVYMVQEGYTYTYDVLNLPGSSSILGLIDVSHIYQTSSTYHIGDYVYYLGTYYEALLFNNAGIIPDASGISSGYWVLLS